MLLKECTSIFNGSTPDTSNPSFWDGDIVWITPKDLSTYTKRYIEKGERNITQVGYNSCSTKILPKNTVLLTSRAPIGYLAISQCELCTNQGFKSLVCNDSIIPLYLYYWLSTKIEYFKSISGGATFKELSKDALVNISINLPDLSIQQHIIDTILHFLFVQNNFHK